MPNLRREPVAYRPFRADPQLAEGLLAVQRPGGEQLRQVSAGLFRLAAEAGAVADDQVRRNYGMSGDRDGVAGRPKITIEGGDHQSIAAQILRDEEGFRETPYWDVNAYRTGYGSDTITRADGSVVRVEKGQRVTREDAERDLARRIPEFENRAAGQVGLETWNRLPANVRGALLSVTYNYGSLPGSVVTAAGSGDIEAIAGSVERLSANKARRGREAAIIRGQGVPAGDASFSVSGGGFVPMAGDTLAARAYNEAGAKRYLQVLNTEVLSTTSQVYDLYSDNPVALEKALGALKSELIKDHVFDEIAADFEVGYGQLAGRYLEQSRDKARKAIEAQDRAAYVERTDALSTDIARRIERMDPDSPAAAELLAQTQAALDDHYDAAVDRGILAPDDAARAKAKARADTAVAFYARQAETRSAEEIAALRETMRADFAEDRLAGVNAEAWERLDAELGRLEEGARTRDARAQAALADRAGKQLTRIESGFDPDPEEINRLKLDRASTPEAGRIVDTAERMMETATVLRDSTLPDARRYVEELRKRTGKDASDADIAVLAYAEERLAKLETLAAKDPVGYEIATGRLELTPLALDQGDDELQASLTARRSEMAAVAETYQRPLEILRPAERTAIARMMTEAPEQLPRLARAMRSALGADAAVALAEIAPEAPALAHAAGVSMATGDDGFMEEVAATLSAKAKGEYKLKMPASEKFASAAGAGFARALSFQGNARQAALQTAQLIFEREANLLGFDPAELGKDGSAATAAWQRALNRALGARVEGGRQTGGLAEVNGLAIVAPAGMDIAMPQRLVSGLTDAQLKELPPIASANGVDVTASQIRRGFLVTAGDGTYRVALGDPLGFEPRWVVGEDGGFWTLDLNRLQALGGTSRPFLPLGVLQ